MSLWQPSWCLILDNFLGQKSADDDDNPSSSATLHLCHIGAQEAGRSQTELTNHSPGSSAYTWPCGLRLPNQLCARIS